MKTQSLSKTKSHFNIDGWSNVLTNVGIEGKDKRLSTRMKPKFLTQIESEYFYAGDDIAKKVIDRLPQEMIREGFKISTPDKTTKDLTQLTDDWFKIHELYSKFEQCLKWARLYGGAALVVGLDDGKAPSEPVDYNSIRNIDFITALHRYDFQVPSSTDLDKNIASKNFKKPAHYQIAHTLTFSGSGIIEKQNETTQKIHHSRVIRFEGYPVEGTSASLVGYWGDSVLSCLFNPITNYQMSHDSSAIIMQDVVKLIVKMKNLSDLISQGDDKVVTARLQLLARVSSVINAIVIQEGEECESKTTTLTGIPELLEMINKRLCAATGMPHTILFGEGATGGIGNKGESEKRDWYDTVKNEQETKLRSPLEKLLKIAYASKNGPTLGKIPEKFSVTFNPLWQTSEKETAETRKIVAETDAIYLDRSVLDANEVASSRFGSGEYSIETKIDTTLRREMENEEPEDDEEETER